MKVIIIGGDAAGMSAAMEIVRNAEETEILVLEQGGIYSYGQCGLPYILDGRVEDTNELIARDVSIFRNKFGIDARTFHKVTAIDQEAQCVRGFNVKTNEPFDYHYDQLLIASGASPVIPGWKNTHLHGIHTIKTIPQIEQLMQDLENVRHVTVIGGGYIGLEVVETLKERGLKVRIINRGKQLMGMLHPTLAEKIMVEANKQGVDVCLGEEILGFEGEGNVSAVVTENGRYPTDLVIVGTGVKPATEFVEGIEKLENGAILVNERMQTSTKNIYAAGDCATHFHRVKGVDDYLPLGTTANKQGRIAGLNLAGQEAIFKGIVGTAVLKFFDLEIGMTGISEKEAKEQNLEVEAYEWQGGHIANFYPHAQQMTLRIVVDKKKRKLLGLQAVGEAGIDKRIDVFATTLYNEMTFEQLVDLDLAYAPPFNGVWDPVQRIAKQHGNFG